MKHFSKLCVLSCMLLFNNLVFSQSPNYLWAKSFGDTADDGSMDVCTDASGNSYSCGYFKSSTMNLGITTLVNADASGATPDIFIAKYDPSGNLLWAKSAGMQYDDAAWGVTCDGAGNLLVTGYFDSPYVVFGADTLFNTLGIAADLFLVKYDPAGNVAWAKNWGGTGFDGGRDVYTDAADNIFVSGWYSSTSATFGSTTLTCKGGFDALLLKCDPSGNPLWARSAGGPHDDRSYGLSLDPSGNVSMTGVFFSDTCFFGTTPLVHSDSAGGFDSFVAKYDAAGTLAWASSVVSGASEIGYGIACDPSGNIYSSGILQNDAPYTGIPMYSGLYNNVFLYKQDPSGNPLWLKVFKSDMSEGYRVACDAAGSVFIAGHFNSDSLIVDTDTLFKNSPTGAFDFFIAKFSSAGNVLWSINDGGDASVGLAGLALNSDGSLIASGGFSCDSLALGSTTLVTSASATNDHFIFKLDASTAGLQEFLPVNSVVVFPNPFSGNTTIELSDVPLKKTTLFIYDISGRLVVQQSLSQKRSELSKGGLKAGMYFYSVSEDNEKIVSGKLIIQ